MAIEVRGTFRIVFMNFWNNIALSISLVHNLFNSFAHVLIFSLCSEML